MERNARSYDRWECRFCGARAIGEVACDALVLASRRCACGAIAIAGPVVDTDEIIDQAESLYHVGLLGANANIEIRLRSDFPRAGIDIHSGQTVHIGEGVWADQTSLWFRTRRALDIDAKADRFKRQDFSKAATREDGTTPEQRAMHLNFLIGCYATSHRVLCAGCGDTDDLGPIHTCDTCGDSFCGGCARNMERFAHTNGVAGRLCPTCTPLQLLGVTCL